MEVSRILMDISKCAKAYCGWRPIWRGQRRSTSNFFSKDFPSPMHFLPHIFMMIFSSILLEILVVFFFFMLFRKWFIWLSLYNEKRTECNGPSASRSSLGYSKTVTYCRQQRERWPQKCFLKKWRRYTTTNGAENQDAATMLILLKKQRDNEIGTPRYLISQQINVLYPQSI